MYIYIFFLKQPSGYPPQPGYFPPGPTPGGYPPQQGFGGFPGGQPGYPAQPGYYPPQGFPPQGYPANPQQDCYNAPSHQTGMAPSYGAPGVGGPGYQTNVPTMPSGMTPQTQVKFKNLKV